MAEEGNEVGQEGGAVPTGNEVDPVKNLKTEMFRKYEGVQKDLQLFQQATQKSLQDIVGMLQSVNSPNSSEPAPKENDPEDFFDITPTQYKEKLLAEAERIADQKLQGYEQQRSQKEAHDQTLATLISEYPEAGESGTPLYDTITEVSRQYDEKSLQDPAVMKAIVYEAAVKTGVQPMSRRQQSEEFSFSGGRRSGQNSKRATEEDKKILTVAKIFGLDSDNEEIKKRLTGEYKERNWLRYK